MWILWTSDIAAGQRGASGVHRRWTGREAAGHPRHGIGEDLTFDPELHRDYLPFACVHAAENFKNVIAD